MILNVFLKKIIFQNRYVALETPLPPFMAKTIVNFHFDYLYPSLSFKSGFWARLRWHKTSKDGVQTYTLIHHEKGELGSHTEGAPKCSSAKVERYFIANMVF